MTPDKAICKYDKKEIREHLPAFVKLVSQPRFICRKCARASADKDTLCRPVKLVKLAD